MYPQYRRRSVDVVNWLLETSQLFTTERRIEEHQHLGLALIENKLADRHAI